MQNFTFLPQKMEKAMDNHCNSTGVLCHLEEAALGTPHMEQVFVEGSIPGFQSCSGVFKASKDYSSHKPPPEGPVEVSKEKEESIPLLLITSFSPQKLTRKAVGSERGFWYYFK